VIPWLALSTTDRVALFMIRTILYPTDLGLFNSYLLKHVSLMAKNHGAKIVALHAVEPMGVFAESVLDAYVDPGLVEEMKNEGLSAVMDAIRQQVVEAFNDEFIDQDVDKSCISDIKVVSGLPSDVIVEQAHLLGADLIVMGSHSQREGNSTCLLYTSPSPRDRTRARMPSSA